jgi:hypothetical protein
MGNIKSRRQRAQVVAGLMMTTTYSKLDKQFLNPRFLKQRKGRLDSEESVVDCGIEERKKRELMLALRWIKKLWWQDLLKE